MAIYFLFSLWKILISIFIISINCALFVCFFISVLHYFFTGKIYTRSLAKIFVQLLVVVVAVVFFILLHFFRLLLFGGYQDFISYFIFRHTRIQRNNNDNNNNKNNNNTNKLSVAQQLRRKNSYEMMQAVKWRRRGRRPRRKGSGEASTQKMAAHQKYTLDLIL